MISFRFHVVSITAVFLAIAIGVVVGSTYVDRAIVDTLQNRINTVSANLDQRKAENDALDEDLSKAESYMNASADFAVTDRLTDVPVLVVAVRGVDESAVEETVRLARRAGGIVPGIAWLEPAWTLEDDNDHAALADLVGGTVSDAPDQLWEDAWIAVAEEVAEPPTEGIRRQEVPVATTAPTPVQVPDAPVLLGLASAGFLTVDNLDDDSVPLVALADSGARVLLVTGSNAAAELTPMVPVVVRATLEGGSVVADVYAPDGGDGPARGERLIESLDESTRGAMAIVDAVDLVEGRVAAVVVLAGAPRVLVGHFGYGPDADGVMPAWSPP